MNLEDICAEIKALPPSPTEVLQAAFDGHDTQHLAMGILAHPFSVELDKHTVARLYQIGFENGLAAPCEIKGARQIASVILDLEVGA